MSDIKTGNKGFVNPVDGKVYHIDQVPVGEDGVNISANLKSLDPGSINVDNTVKDIGKKTRLTLGTYLSKATKGEVGSASVPNKYTIDAPTADTQTSKIVEGGYPAPISPTTNSSKFAGNLPPSVSDNFVKATNTLNNITTIVGKGKSQESSTKNILDGNELLPGVVKNNANVVTLQPALKAYTVAATSPEYRTSFVSLGDFQSPPKGLNVPLLKVKSLSIDGIIDPSESYISYGGLGNDSEVVKPAFLGLDLKIAIQKSKKITENNPYPVSIPDEFNVANLFSITSTDGKYPTSLTTPSNQNSSVFAGNLPPSVSDNYIIAKEFKGGEILSKGKSVGADNGIPDGNSLLSEISISNGSIDANKSPSLNFYSYATTPGFRTSFVSLADFQSPPKGLNVPLLKVKSLSIDGIIDPSESYISYGGLGNDSEVVKPAFLGLDLKIAIQKSKKITENNPYPVSIPDKFDVGTNLTSISSPDGKYPAPLTTPLNQNSSVFEKTLPSSFSDDYSSLQKDGIKLKKGKSPVFALDGNELLSNKKIFKLPNGVVQLNDPVLEYTKIVVEHNKFTSGIREKLQSNTFLDSSVDASAPPGTFEPKIEDVDPAEQKGMYTGAKKNPITLQSLQQKAVDTVAQNKYHINETQNLLNSANLSSLVDLSTGDPSQLNSSADDVAYVARNQIKPDSTDSSLATTGFSKGKEVSAKYDGHNLLSTVKGNLDVVDDKLKNKLGRFDPHASGASYQKGGKDGNESIDDFGSSVNTGDYLPADHPLQSYKNTTLPGGNQTSAVLTAGNSRWAARATSSRKFNPKLKLSDGTEVSHLKMAQVGIGLSQRASGEIPAKSGNPFNPTGDDAEKGALAPSPVQLAILKINDNILSARDTLDDINAEYPEDSLTSISPFDGQSWGTINNVSEPFDDAVSGLSQSITMLLMMISIRTLMLVFSFPSVIKNGGFGGERSSRDSSGRLTLGSYQFKSSGVVNSVFPQDAWETFGLRPTNNTYAECLAAGTNAFFIGVDKADTSIGDLAAGSLGILVDSIIGENSPVGANIVVCRTIIRSGLLLAQAIQNIARQPSTTAKVKGALAVLKIIRSSRIINAMNVFAQLGDVLVDRKKKPGRIKLTTSDGRTVDIEVGANDLVSAKNLGHSTVYKNRLSFATDQGFNYSPTLAWSSQRAPSMYLLPSNIVEMNKADTSGPSTKLDGFLGASGLNIEDPVDGKFGKTPIFHRILEQNEKRIGSKEVKIMEERLDAEYVPFYFHDIRTNEIVSFHAFLASLTDDYTASYDTVEGFGRVEPIKIYKNTHRKIGMSFWVASTSEDDFDHMWYKLNKLTTMVYPQYTAGRTLVGENHQFRAPFSQLPGASPLIRIRLGDLLRSNYSKFAVARLFGAADNDMKLPSDNTTKEVTFPNSISVDSNNQAKADAEAKIKKFKEGIDLPQGTKIEHSNQVTAILASVIENNTNQKLSPNAAELQKLKNLTPQQQQQKQTRDRIATLTEMLDKKKITANSKNTAGETEITVIGYDVNSSTYTLRGVVDNDKFDFSADQQWVKPTNVEVENYTKSIKPREGGTKQSIDALDEFLNPTGNAIVKSFESAGGKGLAGVIESIHYDWYDKITWDIDSGRTAPKLCKVTITFTPIHDITPGLDNRGYNRAPVYPVGNAMNGRGGVKRY